MSTGDPRPKPVEPTGDPRVDALIDALICPTCRTIYNAAKANCADLWHSDNRPTREDIQQASAALDEQLIRVEEAQRQVDEIMSRKPVGSTPVSEEPAHDWGEWTPGKGLERIRTELPGMVPELTAGDLAKADALIAAASKPDDAVGGATVNQKLTVVLPQLPDAEAAEWAARFREAMRHPSRFIVLPPDEDERERAAYARGISEGRRQATEGWKREWAARWMQDAADPTDDLHPCGSEDAAREMERRGGGYRRAESRLVGPWEPAEQPEPDFKPFAEESLTIAEETFAAQAQALDPEVFRQESLGVWPRQGYLCAFGGADCPGHASKWLMCDPAAGGESRRPRMTDGCGPEHTYRGSCEYAGETDRG